MSFWNKKIVSLDDHFFGLDISDFSMKAIEIERGGSHDKIKSYFLVNFPQKVISSGKIVDKDKLTESVKNLRKSGPHRIKTNKVVCSLPEEKSFLRLIQVPPIDDSDKIKEAIKWELESNIPLSVNDVYFDFYILPKQFQFDEKQTSVLVLAVNKEVVNDLLSVLTRAKLEVIGMESESFALARSLLGKEDEDKVSLIIDIGADKTSLLFVVNGLLLFTSSIYLSAQTFTDVISKGLNMTFKEAEKLKIEQGIGSMIKKDPLFTVLEDSLNSLVDEIDRSIEFFIEKLQYANKLEQVILCGGGAGMKGLIPFLAKKLGYPTYLGNPWKNINLGKTIPPMNREESTEYATAIGLALKRLDEKKIFSEFL